MAWPGHNTGPVVAPTDPVKTTTPVPSIGKESSW